MLVLKANEWHLNLTNEVNLPLEHTSISSIQAAAAIAAKS